MEKICTRCNFRNPKIRAVCQVCGYSKFNPTADAHPTVAKESPSISGSAFLDLVQQPAIAAKATLEKISSALKELATKTPKSEDSCVDNGVRDGAHDMSSTRGLRAERQAKPFETPVFKEGEDLDSMIAWFKSYGLDRPIILESKPQTDSSSQSRIAA